jgi:hypothetical protein
MTKYVKYAVAHNPQVGVSRPTALLEGHRFDTSVAAVGVRRHYTHSRISSPSSSIGRDRPSGAVYDWNGSSPSRW